MSDSPKRGKELKKLIKEGIKHLASKNSDYKYNASELARHINTSRVTLNKYSDYIDEVLEEIKVDRKVGAGNGMVKHLLDRIEIFKKIYESSKDINIIFNLKRKPHDK